MGATKRYLTDARRGEAERDYALCRALRHAWEPIGQGERMPEYGALVCYRCVRCGTLRYDRFSRFTGERISNPSYVWPDGYRDTEGRDSAWWRMNLANYLAREGLLIDVPEPQKKGRKK